MKVQLLMYTPSHNKNYDNGWVRVVSLWSQTITHDIFTSVNETMHCGPQKSATLFLTATPTFLVDFHTFCSNVNRKEYFTI